MVLTNLILIKVGIDLVMHTQVFVLNNLWELNIFDPKAAYLLAALFLANEIAVFGGCYLSDVTAGR